MTLRGYRFAARASFAAFLSAVVVVCLSAQEPSSTDAGAQDPAPPNQVFRGSVDFVRVDAYPRRDGRIVEDLTADDFEILEDGRPQAIATFEFVRHVPEPGFERNDPRTRTEAERWIADPARRVFVIYVDYYHITRAASNQIRVPLMEMLKEQIGPSDLVAIMSPETSLGQLSFVQTLNSISADLLDRWEWGLADLPAQPRTPAEIQLAGCGDAGSGFEVILRRFRDDVFFTSLESLIAHMGAYRSDRTHVILLSEGWWNTRGGIDIRNLNRLPSGGGLGRQQIRGVPGSSPGVDQFGRPVSDVPVLGPPSCTEQLMRLEIDYDDRFKRLLRLANANNVAFHTIDVGGLRTDAPSAASRTPGSRGGLFSPNPVVLQELAENTDGRAMVNANDIGLGLRRIVNDTSSYYLLGYASTNEARDGNYREIEVHVKRSGVDVTARRGYTAPSDELMRLAAERDARSTIPTATAGAIGELSRWDAGEPLLAQATDRGTTVDVVVEIPLREYASGVWRNGASVEVSTATATGGTTHATARLPAGSRSVTLSLPIGDSATDRPVIADVRIVSGSEELTTRAAVEAPDATTLGRPRFLVVPAVGRRDPQVLVAPVFRRPERMRVEWAMATAPTTWAVTLTDRRGQPLDPGAAMATSVDAARPALVVDLYTTALADGDYALNVSAQTDGETEEQVVGFRIGR